MFRNVYALVGILMLSAWVLSPTRAAAIELQPGQWQELESGTEDGKPVPPETSTSCMTTEEARNPLIGLSPEKEVKGQCKTYDVKQTATGLSLRWVCGDPKQMAMDIVASFTFGSARSYSGVMKSSITLMGKTTTTDKKIEAKWISAQCKK